MTENFAKANLFALALQRDHNCLDSHFRVDILDFFVLKLVLKLENVKILSTLVHYVIGPCYGLIETWSFLCCIKKRE